MMRNVAGIAFMSLMAAGCTGGSLFGTSDAPSGSSSPSWTDRIAGFFSTGGSSRPQQQAGEPPIPDEVDCPSVAVREGASTLTMHASNQPTPLTLRYQGSLGRLARECSVAAGTMRMRVGVEGRIILGPAGGPGNIEVPLRFAVVREGPEPKTIVTKTYRVPVTMPAGAGNVPFVQIDDNLTFPMPSLTELEAYVVYVGYDTEALKKPPPRPARKTAPKQRPAPKQQS